MALVSEIRWMLMSSLPDGSTTYRATDSVRSSRSRWRRSNGMVSRRTTARRATASPSVGASATTRATAASAVEDADWSIRIEVPVYPPGRNRIARADEVRPDGLAGPQVEVEPRARPGEMLSVHGDHRRVGRRGSHSGRFDEEAERVAFWGARGLPAGTDPVDRGQDLPLLK